MRHFYSLVLPTTDVKQILYLLLFLNMRIIRRQVEDYWSLKFLILALCFLKTHSLSLPTVAEIVREQNLAKLSK